MKSVKFLFSLIFGLFLFVSCVPEADYNGDLLHGIGDIGIGNGGGGNSGGGGTGGTGAKVLSKYNTTDSNGASISYNFTYSNKLLTKIAISDGSLTTDLTYSNGLISKSVTVIKDEQTGTETTSTTKNIEYNSVGNITKIESTDEMSMSGSVINTTDKITVFTYNSDGKITKYIQTASIGSLVSQSFVCDISYTGKNISKVVLTTKMPGSPLPDLVVTSIFSNFDNKIAAFSTLPENFRQLSISDFSFAFYGTGTNNFGKVSITESMMGTTVDATASYSYDSEGYTISASSNGDKSTYEYIKL